MKRLQKAVHRKEPNVSAEKGQFEETRKELEDKLKYVREEQRLMNLGSDEQVVASN